MKVEFFLIFVALVASSISAIQPLSAATSGELHNGNQNTLSADTPTMFVQPPPSQQSQKKEWKHKGLMKAALITGATTGIASSLIGAGVMIHAMKKMDAAEAAAREGWESTVRVAQHVK